MKMNEKIEIMLGRKRLKKTEFAESVGITYRAFANYMNGSRTPRPAILGRIADGLGLTPEFLTDDEKDIELTIEERFIKRMYDSGRDPAEAVGFLTKSRGLFAGNDLSKEDKSFLLEVLTEIYIDCGKEK